MNEICNMLNTNDIHVLAITESRLDSSITDWQVHVDGYNLIRKDMNQNWGGVAMYIQNHLPFKNRDDLTMNHLEAIWVQTHLPYQKPLIIGCAYRPPCSNVKIPKRPPRIIVKRSFKNFNCEEFKRDLAASPWELTYLEDNLDHASECFTKLLTEVMNRHAPVRKRTAKACSAPWIDDELNT